MELKGDFLFKPTKKGKWFFGDGRAEVRFGAIAINPTGDWHRFIPKYEAQAKRGIETYACTVYATLKALITLSIFHGFDLPKNCSERFSAIVANVSPPGANPQDVAESIHNFGVLPDEWLPFDDTIKTVDQFYQPKPMDEVYILEAKEWVKKYEIGNDTLWNDDVGQRTRNKIAILKDALTKGTVCVSVLAWKVNTDTGLYFKNPDERDSHWVQVMGYVDGQYWIINDQYSPFEKHVAWDTDFNSAEVYYLQPNKTGIAPLDRIWYRKLLRKAEEWLKRVLLNPPKATTSPVQPLPVSEPKKDLVKLCALAQQEFEGWWPGSASYKRNNPGNCKSIDGTFKTFATYEEGFAYLENYIRRVATGKHAAYPKGGRTTIMEYTHIYTADEEPAPTNYAKAIAAATGLSTSSPMWMLVSDTI